MPTLNHGKESFFKCLTISSKQVPGYSKKIPQIIIITIIITIIIVIFPQDQEILS